MTLFDHWGDGAGTSEEEAEDSYFVSMTDIMVGLLFIFIIMLMAFALKLKEEQKDTAETRQNVLATVEAVRDEVSRMRGLEQQRAQMLREIRSRLADRGVEVILREGSGVLQLPEELLFDSDKRQLDREGRNAVRHVAAALDEVLPCYTRAPAGEGWRRRCPGEKKRELRLEAVFVEGHTDSTGEQDYNWRLSVDRAINTFRALSENAELATELRNDQGRYLFSVAGYGENRLAVEEKTAADRRQNRRIDLRFVMNRSYESALTRVKERLDSVLERD